MMFNSFVKIKVNRDLYQRLKKTSVQRGYASVDEMIQHVLQQEISDNDSKDDELVENRLRGLGYLD